VYDRKTVRRRRAVLLLLVGCSLILLTASFGGGLRSVERGAMEVFGPIQEGASNVLKPVRDAAGWIGDTVDAKGDLEKTKEERDELRKELIAERGAVQQNLELRRMLNMDRELDLSQQGAVTGRVFSRSPSIWYSTFTVNKGSKDGIREGDPVVNGEGLVGRVRRVSHATAQVLLITDGGSGVPAKVNEGKASGILQPAVGDPNDLRMENLGRNQKVRKGQTIVTLGTISERYPSRFPPRIPIGRITRVDEDEGTVHVRPFADLRELEFVQILTQPAL
jgi:rod shape-determining protein MreC